MKMKKRNVLIIAIILLISPIIIMLFSNIGWKKCVKSHTKTITRIRCVNGYCYPFNDIVEVCDVYE